MMIRRMESAPYSSSRCTSSGALGSARASSVSAKATNVRRLLLLMLLLLLLLHHDANRALG